MTLCFLFKDRTFPAERFGSMNVPQRGDTVIFTRDAPHPGTYVVHDVRWLWDERGLKEVEVILK